MISQNLYEHRLFSYTNMHAIMKQLIKEAYDRKRNTFNNEEGSFQVEILHLRQVDPVGQINDF